MHRRPLLSLLDRYLERFPEDRERAAAIRRFVDAHADCFERSCREGHVTASAWIASPDGSQALLVRHRKLAAWLQPGGHADGDPDAAAVALREAVEETGLATLRHAPWSRESAGPQPFDVDVHRIPARGEEPEPLHYDVRYLLIGDPAEAPRPSAESDDAQWVAQDAIGAFSVEPSLLRMAEKTRRLLGRAEGL
jgi:8-oxo-dGTP pyrophosphatase MutT (NUDIX family)